MNWRLHQQARCPGARRAARATGGRACAGLLALALLAGDLSGCGGTSSRAVVVRVGEVPITKAEVDRWTRVVARGGAFGGFRGQPWGTARRRALALLISSSWLIGEAARERAPVSGEAVRHALAERGLGTTGFGSRLATSGQTLAGVKLELRAELALEALRDRVAFHLGEATSGQVERFYRDHRTLFDAPKVWVVDIVEGLKSAQTARTLVGRVGSGTRFARLAYHKRLTSTPSALLGPATKKAVDHAIYAARPGVVSRPMPLGEGWAVFVVRRVIPSHPEPFARVRDKVAARLRVQRQIESTRALERDYRAYWTSRTSCRPEYVAPGCPQYKGPLGDYEDPFMQPRSR